MTGHQDHPGTGLNPDRSSGPAMDWSALPRHPRAGPTRAFAETRQRAIRDAVASHEPRVMIAPAPAC